MWDRLFHISDATPGIDENIPFQSNDSADRNTDSIILDAIVKNGQRVHFKCRLHEYLV